MRALAFVHSPYSSKPWSTPSHSFPPCDAERCFKPRGCAIIVSSSPLAPGRRPTPLLHASSLISSPIRDPSQTRHALAHRKAKYSRHRALRSTAADAPQSENGFTKKQPENGWVERSHYFPTSLDSLGDLTPRYFGSKHNKSQSAEGTSPSGSRRSPVSTGVGSNSDKKRPAGAPLPGKNTEEDGSYNAGGDTRRDSTEGNDRYSNKGGTVPLYYAPIPEFLKDYTPRYYGAPFNAWGSRYRGAGGKETESSKPEDWRGSVFEWTSWRDGRGAGFGFSSGGRVRGTLRVPTGAQQIARCYEVLGLDPSASVTFLQIRKAFRQRAREWHPDTSKHPRAAEVFHEIRQAFVTLSTYHAREATGGGGGRYAREATDGYAAQSTAAKDQKNDSVNNGRGELPDSSGLDPFTI